MIDPRMRKKIADVLAELKKGKWIRSEALRKVGKFRRYADYAIIMEILKLAGVIRMQVKKKARRGTPIPMYWTEFQWIVPTKTIEIRDDDIIKFVVR